MSRPERPRVTAASGRGARSGFVHRGHGSPAHLGNRRAGTNHWSKGTRGPLGLRSCFIGSGALKDRGLWCSSPILPQTRRRPSRSSRWPCGGRDALDRLRTVRLDSRKVGMERDPWIHVYRPPHASAAKTASIEPLVRYLAHLDQFSSHALLSRIVPNWRPQNFEGRRVSLAAFRGLVIENDSNR